MILFRTAVLAAGLSMPGLAWAQGHAHNHPTPAPLHGGIVAEATGEHWVELVISGDRLTAWISDEKSLPIPSDQLRGKATVLVAGKREEVTLAPAEANSLSGKLAAPPAAKVTAVLALSIRGKPAQVRFVTP